MDSTYRCFGCDIFIAIYSTFQFTKYKTINQVFKLDYK
jgi:hypothetical protein